MANFGAGSGGNEQWEGEAGYREPRTSGIEGVREQNPSERWDRFWLLGPGSSAQSLYPGLRVLGVPAVPPAMARLHSLVAPRAAVLEGKCPCAGPGWTSGSEVTEFLYPCLLCRGSRLEAQGLAQSFGLFIMVRPILIPSWALFCWGRRCHKGRGAGSSSDGCDLVRRGSAQPWCLQGCG